MTIDEKYMSYALQLAKRGGLKVLTNPKVGAVVVYNNKIIGEGFHEIYGEAHAEVNAINSVKDEDKKFLPLSTIYVNLEPCCHTGKTPPCTEKIINSKIKRVVIGMKDPFPKVNGEGINILRNTGIEVTVGVLENVCIELNREFIVYHSKKRPYIIFKWAQTLDGYIDSDRDSKTPPQWLTGARCKQIVHKWRSEIDAIMVGRQTIERDNARLNVRLWSGQSPIKITIDRKGVLTGCEDFFINDSKIILFTTSPKISNDKNIHYIKIDDNDENPLKEIMKHLYAHKIKSLMIEGGTTLFNLFLKSGEIDEARIFTSPIMLSQLSGGERLNGVHAPILPTPNSSKYEIIDNITIKTCYYN